MLTGEELGKAIADAIRRKGVSKAAVAKHFGVKAPSVHDWVKSGRISKDKLPELWAFFSDVVGPEHWGLSHAQWSPTGARSTPELSPSPNTDSPVHQAKSDPIGELHPIAVWEYPDELPEGDFIKVPRLNVHLSAGNGNGEHLEVDLERANPQVFRAEWVRRERLKPGALASMYARGNSMEPRICDGDSLLVDTSQMTVLDGRVYAVWYSGELRVKRLFKRVDGGLVIHSDNDRDYPRMEVPSDQMEHVRIIGRVVHVQGTGGL